MTEPDNRPADGGGSGSSIAYFLLVPFLFSGAAALIAQMGWLRTLTVTLGGSSAALNIILITFMAGLAIGARLAKPLCRHFANYVLMYAILEALLSLYIIASPRIIAAAGSLFVRLLPALGHETFVENLARLLVSGTALLPPTVVMGMTTPILLTAAVRRFRDTGAFAGLLYGVNTLGAAVGALAAGCILIRAVGVSRSLAIAAALNLLAAILATVLLLVFPRIGAASKETPPPAGVSAVTPEVRRRIASLSALAFAGGFCGMALEVVFARLLMFLIGSSYFSHTISIGGFLLGIVAGSLTIGLLSRRFQPRASLVPLLFCFFGIAALSSGLLFEHLPLVLERILVEQRLLDMNFLLLKLTAALILVLLPAMASGMILPYLIHLLTQSTRDVTAASTTVLFFNTVGSVLGVAVTGYVLIDLAGVRNAMFLVTATIFLLALFSLTLTDKRGKAGRFALICGVVGSLAALALIPIRGGVPLIVHSVAYSRLERPTVLHHREDHGTSVSVIDHGDQGARTLMINSLPAGEIDRNSIVEGVIADIGLLSHENPTSLFIAGVGTGRTAGVAGLYTGVETEAVEISGAVISALPYFDDYTYQVTRNEDVSILHGDARHYLRTTPKRYDVILPDVYISALTGTAYLYNVEFFELCARRLNPGGRVVLNIYLNTAIDRVIAASFIQGFQHVSVVRVPYADYTFLVGANEPIRFPDTPWTRWDKEPGVQDRLDKLGLLRSRGLTPFVITDKLGLQELLAGSRPSTDDHPIVDYIQFSGESATLSM